MLRNIRIASVLSVLAVSVALAGHVQAANYVSFNGSVCGGMFPGDRPNISNYYYGAYDTGTSSVTMECPITRNNGLTTTGATISMTVYKASSGSYMFCYVEPEDLYGNGLGAVGYQLNPGVSGTQRFTFAHAPSQAWSTYQVFCALSSGDGILSLSETE